MFQCIVFNCILLKIKNLIFYKYHASKYFYFCVMHPIINILLKIFQFVYTNWYKQKQPTNFLAFFCTYRSDLFVMCLCVSCAKLQYLCCFCTQKYLKQTFCAQIRKKKCGRVTWSNRMSDKNKCLYQILMRVEYQNTY